MKHAVCPKCNTTFKVAYSDDLDKVKKKYLDNLEFYLKRLTILEEEIKVFSRIKQDVSVLRATTKTRLYWAKKEKEESL